jgi:hypothetical protein
MPPAKGSKSWLVIFDPTLKSVEGHSHNYDHAIAIAARERFDRVVVYGDRAYVKRGLSAMPVRQVPVLPLFRLLRNLVSRLLPRRDSGAPPNARSAGIPGPLARLWKKFRALDVAISLKRALGALERSPADRVHVFIQRADLYEIAGVDSLARGPLAAGREHLSFHLLLRHDPDITRGGQESAEVFRARLGRLGARAAPSVHFLTDSEAVAAAYRELTEGVVPITVVPIPTACGNDARRTGRWDSSRRDVRISMLGSSRIEKGFGSVKQLLARFPARFGDARVHLAIQVNRNSPDREVLRVIAWLDACVGRSSDALPVLELLEGPATEDRYFSWLEQTDILMAPYVSPKYVASTSSVFVEALQFGIPCVVPAGTWMAGQIADASAFGLHIGRIAKSIDEIPDLAQTIWRELPAYVSDVTTYRERWTRFNNSERLVDILMYQPTAAATAATR